MALEAPLRSSTGNIHFPFPYQRDMAAPMEADQTRAPFRAVSSPPMTDASSLQPSFANRYSAPQFHLMSPSDYVGPSPVTSNGTETTEIEDDVSDDVHRETTHSDTVSESQSLVLSTHIPDAVRQANGEEITSVIHAPRGFGSWPSDARIKQRELSPKTSPKADQTTSASPENASEQSSAPPARPPISTDVAPVGYNMENATPRAQDLKTMLDDKSRLRSSSTSSLEKIEEAAETDGDEEDYASDIPISSQDDEINALRSALQECWTLCNTLANLSSIHRTRVFNSSGVPDAHEKAWKACWKLCQCLYNSRNELTTPSSVKMNLDLCREFCQALFDVRVRDDETADSILRVSFELNNHLYSSQDSRNIPDQFRERTLDFYITLCHRLMKQRQNMQDDHDHLLRACWGLTENLFSIRQNKRDPHVPYEELLGSAVQACWNLCDIFRDGWTQVRPDSRNTPRAKQMAFPPYPTIDQSGRQSQASNRSSIHSKPSAKSSRQEEKIRTPQVPETPVTEFEDTPISPGSDSPQMPNIMVLGPASENSRSGRWSSNASNLSTYSRGSTKTSSTATTTATTEDANVMRVKVLILRAAMNLGFDRDSIIDPSVASPTLHKFIQDLPAGSFGPHQHHATLLSQYKNSVLTDLIIPRHHHLPPRGKRVRAQDVAKSIQTVLRSSQRFSYLPELFHFVFQFPPEEVDARRNVTIVV